MEKTTILFKDEKRDVWIQKARAANVGEIRTHGGKKMQKQSDGEWKPVKGDKKNGKELKWEMKKEYDAGYGWTRVYSYGNWNIQREGKEKEGGGFEDKGGWVINYKGNPFKGVLGALPSMKIARSVVEGTIKANPKMI